MSCEEIHDNTQEVDPFPWAVILGAFLRLRSDDALGCSLSMVCFWTKNFGHHGCQFAQCPSAVTRKTGAVHYRERSRLPYRQFLQYPSGVVCVRHVVREGPSLGFHESVSGPIDNAFRRQGLALAPLVK